MAAGDLTTLANVKSYLGLIGKPISAITQANPGQITCTAHGLITGNSVGLNGINGMTTLNGTTVTVTVVKPMEYLFERRLYYPGVNDANEQGGTPSGIGNYYLRGI